MAVIDAAALFKGTGMWDEPVWNVWCPTVSDYMLGESVSLREAHYWLGYYRRMYVGKPYPNGRGFYPHKNFRVEYYPQDIE